MDNLLNMLSPSVPGSSSHASNLSQKSKTKSQVGEQQICVKLPDQFIEYIRDFQYHEAVKSGNMYFSFKDAIVSIITSHQEEHPDIAPRPDMVKASEKKTGRKKG